MNEINEALDEFEADSIELAPREVFVITGISGLQWLTARVLENRALAKLHIAWAKAKAEGAKRDEERLCEHFEAQVREAIALETRGKSKGISVPSGRVGFRTTPAGFEVQDVDAYNAWCAENVPDACFTRLMPIILSGHLSEGEAANQLREDLGVCPGLTGGATHEVNKSLVLAYFKRTGELPDGCIHVLSQEKLTFTPAKAGNSDEEEEES